MKKNGETLKATFAGALVKYKKGEYKDAEILCNKILSIDPFHFDSLSMLANINGAYRNFEKAIEFLNKAKEIQPKNTIVIHNLGSAHKEIGKLKEAVDFYNKVLEIDPNHVNANYNLGLVFQKQSDLKKAKNYLKKTINLQNNYGLAHFSLANVHVDLKEYHDAVSCYQKAIEINPNIIGAHNNLGLVFRELNDFQNAIKSYQKAINARPSHAGAHHNLALTYKDIGEFDKAIESHLSALKYEPENLAHYHFLGDLKKDVLDSKLENKVEKILKNEKCTENNKIYGNFLLAKYAKKNKNYEKEFDYLKLAHKNYFNSRIKKFKLGVKYCFEDVLQISQEAKVQKKIKNQYNKIKPIFIIGVPRCGSTMVEKIIGSGKKIISIGEETAVIENFVNKKILEKQSLNLGDVTEVREELNKIYKLKGLLVEKNNFIFTDKSLNNFFYLELIKDIYPEAKIINCNRDSLSSIISIFQNNLTELAWCHELNNIFKYFDNYFEIIDNYISVNPKEIYQLQYENLVNNPEQESKKLMEFCELPWDKKCLEFYKRKDLTSKTASNIQIREAIYKHSSKKYSPYKKLLKEYSEKYMWFH